MKEEVNDSHRAMVEEVVAATRVDLAGGEKSAVMRGGVRIAVGGGDDRIALGGRRRKWGAGEMR
jgi:hypothetical protein